MTNRLPRTARQLALCWFGTGTLILSAYVLLFIVYGKGRDPLWQALEAWWRSGAWLQLTAVGSGYLLLQLLAGGRLRPSRLVKSGVWIVLLPFLSAGSCAGNAYQGAMALGGAEASVRSGAVADKKVFEHGAWERTGDGGAEFQVWNEHVLFVRSDDGWHEWLLDPDQPVNGFAIYVSEESFNTHRLGSSVTFAELPGEGADSCRLVEDVRTQVVSSIKETLVWLLLSYAALWGVRRSLVEESEVDDQA